MFCQTSPSFLAAVPSSIVVLLAKKNGSEAAAALADSSRGLCCGGRHGLGNEKATAHCVAAAAAVQETWPWLALVAVGKGRR